MDLKTIELKLGIPILIAMGSSFHFTFEWSGFFEPTAWLWAVNESPWEHMKLVLFPLLIYTLLTYKWTKEEANNILFAKLVHYLIAFFWMEGIFYLYTWITGSHYLIVDIILFMIGTITGMLVSYKIMKKDPMGTINYIAAFALIFLIAVSVYWTYYPPEYHFFAQHFEDCDIGYGILDEYDHDH